MKRATVPLLITLLALSAGIDRAQAQCVQNQGDLTAELLIDGGNSDGTFTYVWAITFDSETAWITDVWFQSSGAVVTSPSVATVGTTWSYVRVNPAPGTTYPAEHFTYQSGLKLQRFLTTRRVITFAYTTTFTDPVQVRARDNLGNLYTLGFNSSSCGNLPVELTAFDVRADGDRAVAHWETASETNNAGFSVQVRPEGAAAFTTLGFVGGAGTTAEAQRYRYDTETLAPGRYVFRLEQVDFDGSTAFSPEVALEIATDGPMFVHPFTRAVQGNTQIRFSVSRADYVQAQVFNVLGQQLAELYNGPVAGGETVSATLDASNLPAGAYFLRFQGRAFQHTERVTVVR